MKSLVEETGSLRNQFWVAFDQFIPGVEAERLARAAGGRR